MSTLRATVPPESSTPRSRATTRLSSSTVITCMCSRRINVDINALSGGAHRRNTRDFLTTVRFYVEHRARRKCRRADELRQYVWSHARPSGYILSRARDHDDIIRPAVCHADREGAAAVQESSDARRADGRGRLDCRAYSHHHHAQQHEVALDCQHAKKRKGSLGKSARRHQRVRDPRRRPPDRRTYGTVAQQPLAYAAFSTDSGYCAQRPKQTAFDGLNNITEMTVFRMLDTLHPTATGLDQIPAWYLRLGAPIFAAPLARLFDQSLTTGVVPQQWTTAVISPLPKIATPTQASDFRLISVTPVLSRTLERFVVRACIYPALYSSRAQHLTSATSSRLGRLARRRLLLWHYYTQSAQCSTRMISCKSSRLISRRRSTHSGMRH